MTQKSKNTSHKILNIDTSCDETSASVTQELVVLSNIVWSQASLHAKWGGVMPSLAQRKHKERIDFVIEKALKIARVKINDIDAIAVTTTPGLAIALEVGISKAKELSTIYKKPLIPVNHIEAHILSPLAKPLSKKGDPSNGGAQPIKLPAYGLVVSGGNTVLVLIEKIGIYKILAQTIDDALGEALDKGARMIGLGYPGGAILEKFAQKGNEKKYTLPIPLLGREREGMFSYSGLKTALYRLIEENKKQDNDFPGKKDIYDLAASYQNAAFTHLLRVAEKSFEVTMDKQPADLLVGGGVASNIELRKKLRSLGSKSGLKIHFPYSKNLCIDNAAMIGIPAVYKAQKREFASKTTLDREPRLTIESDYLKT